MMSASLIAPTARIEGSYDVSSGIEHFYFKLKILLYLNIFSFKKTPQ